MITLTRGNTKLGRDTFILSMNSAIECPSRKLGLCQLNNPNTCYAFKEESRWYKNMAPYRARQTSNWKNMTAREIADGIILHRKGIRWLRFSEAGDFEGQEDVDKMSQVADELALIGVRVYGYTARKDLDFSKVSPNMVVTGSGFMVHNQFTATKNPEGRIVCPGNCRTCHICKARRGINIEVRMH